MRLSKDVFMALAAVAWADGEVSQEESEGVLHAARECGLEGADLDAVKQALRTKAELKTVRNLVLSPRERVYVYAIATWLVRIDGVVMPEERMMLAQLGDHLKLADGDRTRASAASFSIGELAGPDKPSRYDVLGLAVKLQSVMAPTLPPPMSGEG